MLKAGLIAGGITLVLATIGAFVFPLACVPCVALLAGTGAGYLAGQFDRPGTGNVAAGNGAKAGAIAGIAALLAHLVGGAYSAFAVGPGGAAALAESLGVPATESNPAVYYASTFGAACCFGLFEVALMAGVGALGGYLWYQMVGSKGAPPAPAAPAM
jgi:hypothetical protein